MTTYFFHLHECGTVVADEEGSDLAGLETARAWAVVAARELMCGEIKEGRLCLGCCIVIEDETHREVARVPFREAVALSGL